MSQPGGINIAGRLLSGGGYHVRAPAIDIAEVGNTSAASIPIALDRAWRAGKVVPGDVVLTVAFGAGFAWGANLIRWTAAAPRERAGA